MRRIRVANKSRWATLGDRVLVAEWWWQRLRGLLGRPALQSGEGLLLTPCRAVHMAGMKYPLDVAFLDRQGIVVALYHSLLPGRRSSWHARAHSALELPAGTLSATGTREGDTLLYSPARGAEPSRTRLEPQAVLADGIAQPYASDRTPFSSSQVVHDPATSPTLPAT